MRYIRVPYMKRRHFTRKIRETESEVYQLKREGDWLGASRLQQQLRNCWWGYRWLLSH